MLKICICCDDKFLTELIILSFKSMNKLLQEKIAKYIILSNKNNEDGCIECWDSDILLECCTLNKTINKEYLDNLLLDCESSSYYISENHFMIEFE